MTYPHYPQCRCNQCIKKLFDQIVRQQDVGSRGIDYSNLRREDKK